MQYTHIVENRIEHPELDGFFCNIYLESSDNGSTSKLSIDIQKNDLPDKFASIEFSFDIGNRCDPSGVVLGAASLIGICVTKKLLKYSVDQVRDCYDKSDPNITTAKRAKQIADCLGGKGTRFIAEVIKALISCTTNALGGSDN